MVSILIQIINNKNIAGISLLNKKAAFGDCTFSGRLSCYSVISSLQIFDDISYIIRKTADFSTVFLINRRSLTM